MSEGAEDLLFDVDTPLGFRVRVTKAYWTLLTTVKHPAMLGREKEVEQALVAPEQIRRSSSDADVYLFYRATATRRWVCAVSKHLGDDVGFLITAYPTDAIKEGEQIWPA